MSRTRLMLYHVLLLGAIFAFWYAMTTPGLVSTDFATKTAFFFGRPLPSSAGASDPGG